MKEKSQEKIEENTNNESRGGVVIEVRFHPNGRVNMINNRPAHMDPQDWFDFLCQNAVTYRPLSGGRGSFALSNDRFEEIRALRIAAE